MRLHFSIGDYDYRRRTARFRESIHFSITQVLFADLVHWRSGVDNQFSFTRCKSWCRQAPIFRRWEECCSLLIGALLLLTHFWPSSTPLRGHLATLSLLVTDPQFLERWGFADEVHRGKFIRAKDLGLEFWYDVQQPLWTSHVGLASACRCSSGEKTSAASCPEIRNPIVVHQKTDV